MSDQQASIINCAAYKQGHKAQSFPIDDISEVMSQPDTFVWVGLLEPDDALLTKMQEEFGLHDLAVEDARHAHQSPKLEEYGDTLFVVVYSAKLVNGKIVTGETHIFIGATFILSVRHGNALSYRSVRERCEDASDKLAQGPGYVLYALIDFVVDQYQPCLKHLQKEFRRLEEELFSVLPPKDNLQSFYQLKNEIMVLEAAAVPLAEICTGLLRFHGDIIPKESRIYYRDILDHVGGITADCDRMREMINAAMQVALAQITIRQNEVVKKLAGWGAILAVPTMVFSLYGMNFQVMPELGWKYGYPAALTGVILGCSFLYRKLRKVGWI
ncbi:magnesium and cobalt transport protein CorA [Pseudomonas sp. KU26590]|uniref:magnesium and cobalt transport protein CorA n=1 Tax=Pseudomonas sp. KU26590 TaxID=2991051 RepID=UPI00223CB9EE|nr:magnesium and cobalt transport protein CorA [Pseudomonas sp. KU26590]UZJ59171.1 magnesium and cobalt transport protein CorA [Pseudomonas sp. KU26590]